jgi:hypothetical protein
VVALESCANAFYFAPEENHQCRKALPKPTARVYSLHEAHSISRIRGQAELFIPPKALSEPVSSKWL